MNVIRKCCLRCLKENKKRTIVTIAGVALATGLITATACMIMSFYASFVEDMKQTQGDAHVIYSDVRQEDLKYFEQNQNFESITLSSPVGFVDLQETKDGEAYLYLRAAAADWYGSEGVQLMSGRMPEKEDEIIVGHYIRTDLGLDYRVGDQVSLQIGQRVLGDRVLKIADRYQEGERVRVDEEKTYTVVGLFRGGFLPMGNYYGDERTCVSAFTYLDLAKTEEGRSFDVSARYTKWGMKHCEQVNAGLSDAAGSITVNDVLLGLENVDLRDKGIRAAAALLLAVFLIIMLAGIFSIINSFDISLTEKIRFYGMMSSVGTTRRQRRQMVWSEAFFIGSIGIAGGLAMGILFAYGLVKFVNAVLSRQLEYELVFGLSWPALFAAVLLSALMVFLSAVESADRAAKISPIEAIRSNDTVKNPGRPRRTPGYVKKVFGVGGCIAYQNFQRAKVKYRTIVITIVVSISVFIGMSALRYAFDAVDESRQNTGMKYQLDVMSVDPDGWEKMKALAKTPGVLQAQISQGCSVLVKAGGLFGAARGDDGDDFGQEKEFYVYLDVLDEESFRAYCGLAGISYEEAKDKAIVNATRVSMQKEVSKVVRQVETIASFQEGDVISGEVLLNKVPVSVEVACQTQELPLSFSDPPGLILFSVSESWAKKQPGLMREGGVMYLACEDPFAMEETVLDSELLAYDITYYSDWEQESNRLATTVFLAGFIGVIILIGITNVFNALTTNMELRAPEFARLRAIGMTGKEFKSMIWMEGFFYGGRALLIGLPVGVGLSYGLYWTILSLLAQSMIPYEYHLPVPELLLSMAAVFFLLFVIMRYCMNKIGRRNIIETIRNENI